MSGLRGEAQPSGWDADLPIDRVHHAPSEQAVLDLSTQQLFDSPHPTVSHLIWWQYLILAENLHSSTSLKCPKIT
ncbi:hypothetical protein V5P93_003903 [Actinokineospora auranticolor]|uniref:hypothetical protein n=1 Tax=Actinokineospora auranticolor TaxID=155976 RepID=UPI0011B0BD7C|nr:hypothetical protein [Actinokineospora auranticolor]